MTDEKRKHLLGRLHDAVARYAKHVWPDDEHGRRVLSDITAWFSRTGTSDRPRDARMCPSLALAPAHVRRTRTRVSTD